MFLIGRIIKVRSNKGEVVFTSPSSACYTPNEGEKVLLKSEKYQKEYKIEYLREINDALVVKFIGINTINEALRLVGYSIYGLNDLKEEIEDDKMEGFIVIDINGKFWGEVNNIDEDSLNKLLEIQGKEDVYYVPFIEEIVREINKEERFIIIDPPDGLMDINKK